TARITASYGGASDSVDIRVQGSYAVALDGLRDFAGRELASASEAAGFVRVRVHTTRLAAIADSSSPQLVGEWLADGETEASWKTATLLPDGQVSTTRELSFLL